MQLIFIYGQPAAGKLTVARALAEQTGLPLFHNHLIVDAVAAIFPFASPEFVRLREQFWLDAIGAAARADKSFIFTFAPESTVAPDFPKRVTEIVMAAGGKVVFVALTLADDIQEQRVVASGRGEFGKMRSADLLRQFKGDFRGAMAAMPAPDLTIDTGVTEPAEAARQIAAVLSG